MTFNPKTIMKTKILLPCIMFILLACNKHTTRDESKRDEVIQKVEITVTGMSCTGCEETITKSVEALEGVEEATASYKEGKAWVSYFEGSVSEEQISSAIEKTGYKVTDVITVE
jgi:copper chaperone CopZ